MKQTISSAKLKSIPYPKQKQKKEKKKKRTKSKKRTESKYPNGGQIIYIMNIISPSTSQQTPNRNQNMTSKNFSNMTCKTFHSQDFNYSTGQVSEKQQQFKKVNK